MDITAVIFPGQGSQLTGMGKDFFEQVKESRIVYEEASDALGWNVAAICFEDEHRLNLTEFTQPCILTTEIAMLRGLFELYGFAPSIYGGHSLGEITALVSAGVLPLSTAVKIVQYRGRLMQEASPVGFGGMSAIVADNIDVKVLSEAITGLPVDIANINSSRQVVISGAIDALPEAELRIKNAMSDKKKVFILRLNVSAPFHSRYMRVAEKSFETVLRNSRAVLNSQKAMNVTSNYTGTFHNEEIEDLIRSLTLQMGHPVRWKENMEVIGGKTDKIYEIGPKRQLAGDFKLLSINCKTVNSITAAQNTFEKSKYQEKE